MSEYREALQRLVSAIDETDKSELHKKLRQLCNLSETYWSQADSESYAQNKRSDETHKKRVALMAEIAGMFEPAAAEKARERYQEGDVLLFIGWLSGDIAELRKVEVPRLADSWRRFKEALTSPPASKVAAEKAREQTKAIDLPGYVKPDNTERVHFYEQDFYVLSNFSAFNVQWNRQIFATSEHAYHWAKFPPLTRDENGTYVRDAILNAPSAHEAFKLAERFKSLRRADWDAVKVEIMHQILRAKADQHEYVRRKLLETGDRELVEDSWRDPFWGWGPQRDGQNMLGKLWMEIRAELRVLPSPPAATGETKPEEICSDCPPRGYPTDKTRCDECPRGAK